MIPKANNILLKFITSSEASELSLNNCSLTDSDLLEVINMLRENSCLDRLEILGLENNDLSKLPYEIEGLKGLKYITVENNSLHEFPVEVTKCKNLERLFLNENPFENVHRDISELKKLKELDLSITNIDSTGLPDSMTQLENLTKLSLNNCKKFAFNGLPKVLWDLNKLEKLELKFCNLNDQNMIDMTLDLIEQGTMEALTDLDLTGNKLGRLPALFLLSRKLKYLTLDKNNEGFYLFGIKDLKELTEISLVSLGLEDEDLDEIIDLPNLGVLDLSDNKIKSISEKFEKFLRKESVDEVLLQGNPLSQELKEILDGIKSVRTEGYKPIFDVDDDDDISLSSDNTIREYLSEDSTSDLEDTNLVDIDVNESSVPSTSTDYLISPSTSFQANVRNTQEDDVASMLSGLTVSSTDDDSISSIISNITQYAELLESLIDSSTNPEANASNVQEGVETSILRRSISISTNEDIISSMSSDMSEHAQRLENSIFPVTSFRANASSIQGDNQSSILRRSMSNSMSQDSSSLSSGLSSYETRLQRVIESGVLFRDNAGGDATSRLHRPMDTSITGSSSSLSSNSRFLDVSDLSEIQSFTINFRELYKEEGEMNKPLKAYIKLDNKQSFGKISVSQDGKIIQKDITAKGIVSEFISALPVLGQERDEIYIPTAKTMLGVIFNKPESEEAKTMVSAISTCLGACRTPVKSLLGQYYMFNVSKSGTDNLSTKTKEIFGREALENLISEKLNDEIVALVEFLKRPSKGLKDENIEIVQGLLNSVFLAEKHSKKPHSKLQISGTDFNLDSKTINIDFGFDLIAKSQNLMNEFAKLICKTNSSNELLLEGEKYIFDVGKYNIISEAFFSTFGIISEREKRINKFKSDFDKLIYNELFAVEAYEDKDVIAFCIKENHVVVLRNMLAEVNESNIDHIATRFLETLAKTRDELREKHKKLVEQREKVGELLTPINLRAPSVLGGAPVLGGASISSHLSDPVQIKVAEALNTQKAKNKGGRITGRRSSSKSRKNRL